MNRFLGSVAVTDEQREVIERLERRVEVLEELVRRLSQTRAVPELRPRSRPAAPSAPAVIPAAPPPAIPRRTAPSIATDLEQWFGQRGLLVVGSAALLAAGAFFLKYAIDNGWIAPLVRSLAAIASGTGLAAWGDQRIRRGMPRYGAAMISAGGGLVFLGLWAATGPYGLIDRRVGVLLLAASTVLVTLLALHHEIEGLALWALVGAYLAPLMLPPPVPNYDALLGYLEVVGIGTALLAYTMSWRRTFDLALFGYLLLAAAGASPALQSPLGCWLIAAGAVLTLHVTWRRAWPEARLGILLIAWIILGASLAQIDSSEPGTWLAFGAALAVWGLLWWQEVTRDIVGDTAEIDSVAAVERTLFVLSPAALLLIAAAASLRLLQDHHGLLAALLGGVYLATGWVRRSAAFVIMGFALGALAMALDWRASNVVVGWAALAGAALALERVGDRPGGRVASVGLATGAFVCLFSVALQLREPSAPVLADPWALALYVYVAATALYARWWGVESKPTAWERSGAELDWVLCGAAVFAGGSIELSRYFGRIRLAGDLALSVWWLVYAGALVSLGFRLNRKVVRSAGLAVAAGAGLKIVLYDLSNLEALYRVASFFALALIALAVAYAYNRKASREMDKAALLP